MEGGSNFAGMGFVLPELPEDDSMINIFTDFPRSIYFNKDNFLHCLTPGFISVLFILAAENRLHTVFLFLKKIIIFFAIAACQY